MDFIVYAFILIYLPKCMLHSINLYDLGNSPDPCGIQHCVEFPLKILYVSVVPI